MTRAREIADIWSREYQTDALYSSGYTDAFSSDGNSVTVARAVRVIKGESHDFTNLTFNVPMDSDVDVSEWTDPRVDADDAGLLAWSYLYVRPSDEKFFLSDTAPNRGENFRTFGGEDAAYLFPLFLNSERCFRFNADSSKVTLQNPNAPAGHQKSFPGKNILQKTFTPAVDDFDFSFDAAGQFPATATVVEGIFLFSQFLRRDDGQSGEVRCYFYMENNNGDSQLIAGGRSVHHLKSPVAGNYYFCDDSSVWPFTVSLDSYDPALCRVTWNTTGTIFNGGDSRNSAHIGYQSFIDRSIF